MDTRPRAARSASFTTENPALKVHAVGSHAIVTFDYHSDKRFWVESSLDLKHWGDLEAYLVEQGWLMIEPDTVATNAMRFWRIRPVNYD